MPPEVLQSISKNFSELQREFDKSDDVEKSDAVTDVNIVSGAADVLSSSSSCSTENRLKRFLRIKRVKSFGDEPPKGTVARILIQVFNSFRLRQFGLNSQLQCEQLFVQHLAI